MFAFRVLVMHIVNLITVVVPRIRITTETRVGVNH